MYTDEDLDMAVENGIFSESAVAAFRAKMSDVKQTVAVDEENFRLITGFNDIFVVIACALLLFSSVWAARAFSASLAYLLFPVLAWGLAEFFVRQKKMALPAIVLLLSFVGGVFNLGLHWFGFFNDFFHTLMVSAAASAIAAYLHWCRFRVPITVAAGAAAIAGLIVATVLAVFPQAKHWMLELIFICGVCAFLLAMYWDVSDRERLTRRSDVAFWLHLLAAPLIVHPVFSNLGILEGNESLLNMAIVIVLYLFMTFVSIVVDRRAFMVSSLIYVLYALSSLLELYGVVGYSFAVTGVCIGAALLFLSAFWHGVRARLVTWLPSSIQQYVPKINQA
jgi:hypothetical protein